MCGDVKARGMQSRKRPERQKEPLELGARRHARKNLAIVTLNIQEGI